jgi:site-specific DNA-methyltransferase (cytosine-N4-specific)
MAAVASVALGAPGVKTGTRAQPQAGASGEIQVAYKTALGEAFQGRAERFLSSEFGKAYKGKAQLIFTSPPFPLNRKKNYGNETADKYVDWLADFAPKFAELLKPRGSIVLEMGNAWEAGKPIMSTLALEALLEFLKRGNLKLCQQFVCYNKARLPSPAQWVNIERIRLKDAYTHVWWMSPDERPLARNGREGVVAEYSDSMLELFRRGTYNSGKRPSQHNISKKSFLKRHKGAIRPSVLEFSNTRAFDPYLRYCRKEKLQTHPARMPIGLAEFFIRFLTNKSHLVADPFAGCNTTGAAAERLGRRWIAIEEQRLYLVGSRGWFPELAGASANRVRAASAATYR